MSKSRKGDIGERALVNALDAIGVAVMRAPSSGSATDRELPDVLAGDGEHFYAIEVKSSSGNPIYLDNEEIKALNVFSNAFGATPLIGAKFNVKNGDHAWGVDGDPGHRFWSPSEILTENDAYRVKRERWENCSRDIFSLYND